MPRENIPIPLTPSGVRALAATMAGGANPTIPPHTVTTVIDALDAVSKTLLVTILDLTPAEALAVQDVLWRWDR